MEKIRQTNLVKFELPLAAKQRSINTIEKFFKTFPSMVANQALGSFVSRHPQVSKQSRNTGNHDNTNQVDTANQDCSFTRLTLNFPSFDRKVSLNVENMNENALLHFIQYYNMTCSLNCCTFHYTLKEKEGTPGKFLEIIIETQSSNTALLAETENFLAHFEALTN